MASDLVRITGLWANTKSNGEVYFTGNFGSARITIFKNGYKGANSNEPDYIMYVSTPKPKAGGEVGEESNEVPQ